MTNVAVFPVPVIAAGRQGIMLRNSRVLGMGVVLLACKVLEPQTLHTAVNAPKIGTNLHVSEKPSLWLTMQGLNGSQGSAYTRQQPWSANGMRNQPGDSATQLIKSCTGWDKGATG